MIAGPAGRLEALLEEPESDPLHTALVLHPHPQHGGTMHNKVVYRLARGLRAGGAAVLRFNYRGVNLSEGVYDHGRGELEDARTALAWLRARYPTLPFRIAGFSFGARIALRLGEQTPGTLQIVAAGFPTRYGDQDGFAAGTTPRVFVQGTNDPLGPKEEFQAFHDSVTGPSRVIWIESADHFFSGGLDRLESEITRLTLAGQIA